MSEPSIEGYFETWKEREHQREMWNALMAYHKEESPIAMPVPSLEQVCVFPIQALDSTGIEPALIMGFLDGDHNCLTVTVGLDRAALLVAGILEAVAMIHPELGLFDDEDDGEMAGQLSLLDNADIPD